MPRPRALSPAARTVLAALAASAPDWAHGYDLCQQANISSGTLYPLLIRLEGQGYLEAEWQPPAGPGRPARHAYRLTASGRALARENPPAKPSSRAALKVRRT